jgi:hypothetical protein
MQRKNWDTAEAEFQKSLALDANNGELDYFMGTVLASEKRREKLSAALFYFARAASYDGAGGLTPAGRQQVLDYVKRAYQGYHGSDEGFYQLLATAKAQTAPAGGYFLSANETKEQEANDAEDAKNPQLNLWKNLKASLTGADGASYFEMGMKGALLPPLKGKVVKLEPELKPKTVVLALEDGTTPDATLKFEMPLAGKVDPGAELTFEGVPDSYTASPYMVVFNVEADKLHGWTGKNAPKAPVRKKTTASN